MFSAVYPDKHVGAFLLIESNSSGVNAALNMMSFKAYMSRPRPELLPGLGIDARR